MIFHSQKNLRKSNTNQRAQDPESFEMKINEISDAIDINELKIH